jgi:hypothetical protein
MASKNVLRLSGEFLERKAFSNTLLMSKKVFVDQMGDNPKS